ncbi:unnamed protein product [Colias eurytheme]|nr:unnamed protein product [Colias eurytheme]
MGTPSRVTKMTSARDTSDQQINTQISLLTTKDRIARLQSNPQPFLGSYGASCRAGIKLLADNKGFFNTKNVERIGGMFETFLR